MLLYLTVNNLNQWDFIYTDNRDWRLVDYDLIDEEMLEDQCINVDKLSIIILRHPSSKTMYAVAYGRQFYDDALEKSCIDAYKFWRIRGPDEERDRPIGRSLFTVVPLIMKHIHGANTVIFYTEEGTGFYGLNNRIYGESGLIPVNPRYTTTPAEKGYIKTQTFNATEFLKLMVLDSSDPKLCFHASIMLNKKEEKQRFARLYLLDRRMGRRWAQDHG